MKFINVIRNGDFVRLKTLSQLEDEFGLPQKGGIVGSLFFGDRNNLRNNLSSAFLIHKNAREELGNVLRIKRVENAKLSDSIFFHAENNGISYDYEDTEVVFEKQIVDAVLINGTWHQVNEDLNNLSLE